MVNIKFGSCMLKKHLNRNVNINCWSPLLLRDAPSHLSI